MSKYHCDSARRVPPREKRIRNLSENRFSHSSQDSLNKASQPLEKARLNEANFNESDESSFSQPSYSAALSEQFDERLYERERKKMQRARETSEQKEQKLRKDRERKRLTRENETDRDKSTRNQKNIESMRLARENETSEERSERNRKNLESMRMVRENETSEERSERNRRDSINKRIIRENENRIVRSERLRNDAIRHKKIRDQKEISECPTYKIAQFHERAEKISFGDMNLECIHCKGLHWVAQLVQGKGNSFDDCCNHGKVKIKPLPDFPSKLRKFLSNEHRKSNQFFENLRRINSSLAFATMNPLTDKIPGRGPYCFRIHGQIYHKLNIALHPDSGEIPTHGHLFIIDPEDAIKSLERNNDNVDNEVLHKVFRVIKQHSPFVEAYEMMYEEEEKQIQLALQENRPPYEVKLFLSDNKNLDKRVYNLPRVNEVAVVFVCDSEGNIPEPRIVIKERGKELKFLNSNCDCVDGLLYPIFLPKGTSQWHPNLKKENGKRISRSEYIRYRLAIKPNEFNPFLHGKKLFQQYCVDQYVRVENDRMKFIREHQKELCCESYHEIVDWIEGEQRDKKKLKKIVLPSSVTGSPRYIDQSYQDAMAIVRKFGKPDLFLTMTCNPNWPEITNNLFPGQRPEDRPDLIVKVFRMYMKELINEITKGKIFGKVKAWLYVVEFQKRGLPHIHLLITLDEKDKLRNPDDVDQFMSAQLPDPREDPEGYDLVKRHMMHGPCGDLNPKCPCMEEIKDKKKGNVYRKCSKNYPMSLNEETVMDKNGYPSYARPDNGLYAEVRGEKLNNSWVVPHNLYLLKRFNCHINVECIHNIKSVKYLFKYVHKGHDKAEIEIIEEDGVDEVKEYQDTRYVTPPDALWRIYGYEMQERSHSIKRLPVHLSGNQTVYINKEWTEQQIREKMNLMTELTAYFELNKKDPEAREKLYHEIPEDYIFEKGEWRKRKKHFNTIGRMHFVRPTNMELYCLRLLLCHIKGAKSYEELRTVDDELCNSFQDACIQRGLIKDDQEWIWCLNEAKEFAMPWQLRSLFARILAHCHPLYPKELWETFKDALSEDYVREFGEEIAYTKAYKDIIKKLKDEGKSISEFPDMEQVPIEEDNEDEEYNTAEETAIGMKKYDMLTDEQRMIVNEVISNVENSQRRSTNLYFINGAGGYGKTFTYEVVCHLVRGKGKSVAVMAPTGIAATLLRGGRTVHSRFNLDLNLTRSSIKYGTKEWNQLNQVEVIIIDEAPMLQKNALKLIDEKLREITDRNFLFGNKIMILGGDFRQTLPIQKHATKSQLIDLSLRKSYLWKFFKKYKLTKNLRALSNEQEFAAFLLDLGDGKLNDDNDEVQLPAKCVRYEEMEEEIFGSLIDTENYYEISKRAILAPLNIDVDEINENVLNKFIGEEKVYLSVDKAENETGSEYLSEYLNSLHSPSLPKHEIRLKENATVIITRNLNVKAGICNGTRLRIRRMGDRVLECEILTGDKIGEKVLIPRITLYEDELFPFTLSRHQFPMKLAFALTINKSQGQTFDMIGIDLRNSVFQHGQLYVGFSRTRSWDSILVRLNIDNIDRKVKNIVYKEMLEE